MKTRLRLWMSSALIAGLLVSSAHAGNNYDEATSGDLSSDFGSPTLLVLAPGDNLITGSMGTEGGSVDPDRDYVHVQLPVGSKITALLMNQYVTDDDGTAFIGVQAGSALTLPPTIGFDQVGGLLGWTHFGTNEGDADGVNLLPRIGTGAGAMGFTPPLGGPDYTFWIQQLGPRVGYQFDVVVSTVPEPTGVMLACAGLTGPLFLCQRAGRFRRRKSNPISGAPHS